MPQSYSKRFHLTDDVNGHRICPQSFGLGECEGHKFYIYYMYITDHRNRRVQIKFGKDDDWGEIYLPVEFSNLLLKEFWIRDVNEDEPVIMVTIKGVLPK